MRSFFGLPSGDRKVIGKTINFDLKDVEHIRNSNSRLTSLQKLLNRYKNTHHEPGISAVLEKTKSIHHYLVNKNRVHELELFHIQNTDHFINTFNVIMDVHQSPKESSPSQPRPEIIDIVNKQRDLKRTGYAPKKNSTTEQKQSAPVYSPPVTTESAISETPNLVIPDIVLNTFSKITYHKKDNPTAVNNKEIGFFSPKDEKEEFLLEVAARLNLPRPDIAYVGNAMVNFPDENLMFKQLEYVPIIHWKGFIYALNLKDYRVFPVTMGRKDR
ncbi:MAG: hypothetical protein M3512_06260 [Bacteroidota bacterium]|nr:hypothetical protein [Bacteroidota bacterium]